MSVPVYIACSAIGILSKMEVDFYKFIKRLILIYLLLYNSELFKVVIKNLIHLLLKTKIV